MESKMNGRLLISALLAICSMSVNAASGDLQRLSARGNSEADICTAMKKQALIGHESQPTKVSFGGCICAPFTPKGGTTTLECALYYTYKN
jgi:hypothetical protein